MLKVIISYWAKRDRRNPSLTEVNQESIHAGKFFCFESKFFSHNNKREWYETSTQFMEGKSGDI